MMSFERLPDPARVRIARKSFSHEYRGKLGRLILDRQLAIERRNAALAQGKPDPIAVRHIQKIDRLILKIRSEMAEMSE